VQVTERDRRLLAAAVRHGRLVPSQAGRWEWSASPSAHTASNRLGRLASAGLLRCVPLRRGEGVYVPTPAGARLVPDLTGGLSAPRVPDKYERRWASQLPHDLTIPEVERWLLVQPAAEGGRFLIVRELFSERAFVAGECRAHIGGQAAL
jgi:hypothetical protein